MEGGKEEEVEEEAALVGAGALALPAWKPLSAAPCAKLDCRGSLAPPSSLPLPCLAAKACRAGCTCSASKCARYSSLDSHCTGGPPSSPPLTPAQAPWAHLCQRLSQVQGPAACTTGAGGGSTALGSATGLGPLQLLQVARLASLGVWQGSWPGVPSAMGFAQPGVVHTCTPTQFTSPQLQSQVLCWHTHFSGGGGGAAAAAAAAAARAAVAAAATAGRAPPHASHVASLRPLSWPQRTGASVLGLGMAAASSSCVRLSAASLASSRL